MPEQTETGRQTEALTKLVQLVTAQLEDNPEFHGLECVMDQNQTSIWGVTWMGREPGAQGVPLSITLNVTP